MAKSKKPRKKYNPNKNLCQTPVTLRYSKEEGDRMKYRVYFHLGRLNTDDCGAGDYLALNFRFKVGLGLIHLFDQPEAKDVILNGIKVLESVKENRIKTGSWRINKEIDDKLRMTCSLIDDVQDMTTRKEQLPVFIKAEKELEHALFDTLP